METTQAPPTDEPCSDCDLGAIEDLACNVKRFQRQAEVASESLTALTEARTKFATARADYQAARTRHVDDEDMAYLMRRFRQTHDVWHALLGLGIAGHEEVVIHAFSWGQLRLPVSALVVLFGTVKHIVLERRWGALRHSLREAYELGRDAQPLLPVVWEDQWSRPLAEVRARYRLRPLERRWLD